MKTILLIENETILAKMYQEKFSQAGFRVIWKLEAKEGLSVMEKEKIDLVILDILLSREDGIFFLEKLTKDPKMINVSSTPVIVFSNYDDLITRKKALELGVKDYLIKTNYTPKQIIDTIKKYI
ncbi:MAG: response regulator [Patescibacteria group bacterium]|nr:response regulator [Patescibacteria group bacterium]MBU1877184.1 response regulator [Patescibacteria group bacterium]